MKKIELKGKLGAGKFALVDDADYEELNKHKWYLTDGYAVRTGSKERVNIRMHRAVMETPKGLCTDHINRDRLDNQKENLRICTVRQNSWNAGPLKGKSSKYKGVTYKNREKAWVCSIRINGEKKQYRGFKNETEAAKAYDKMAKEAFGEFACLNFKDKP